MMGAEAEGDSPILEWTKSLDRAVCRDKRPLEAPGRARVHPCLRRAACERFLLKSRGKRVRVRLHNRLRRGHKSQHCSCVGTGPFSQTQGSYLSE